VLIILSRSPRSENYGSILEIARKAVENGKKVAILHIQDACIASTIDEHCDQLAKKKIELYTLKADCEARGLTRKVNRRVKLVDYKQWVRLVMDEHRKIVSWTS